jgi:hypothetical protein
MTRVARKTSLLECCCFGAALFCLAGSPAIAQNPESATRIQLERQLKPVDDSLREMTITSADVDSAIAGIRAVIVHLEKARRSSEIDSLITELRGKIGGQGDSATARLLVELRSRFLRPLTGPLDSAYQETDSFILSDVLDAARDILTLADGPYSRLPRTATTTRPGVLSGGLSQGDFTIVQDRTTAQAFDALRKTITDSLQRSFSAITDSSAAMRETLGRLSKRAEDLVRRIGLIEAGSTQIDLRLITWSVPTFAITFLLLLIIPRLYSSTEVHKLAFDSPILLELITVFLLAGTVLLLGLGNKLEGEVLGTLLGGISGYVLGRHRGAAGGSPNTTSTPTPPAQPGTPAPPASPATG